MELAIAGIVVTIIFGAGALYYVLRRHPGRVAFVVETSIGLFDSFLALPELTVLFKDEPVKENVVFLKGYLVNVGRQDIGQAMVEDELTIVLPEGFSWLAGKLVDSSPGVRASVASDERRLKVSLQLFRCNESIGFEALASVPKEAINLPAVGRFPRTPDIDTEAKTTGEQVIEAMRFEHRIKDTARISKMTVKPKVVGEWKKRLRGFAVTLAIVASVFILIWALPRDEADIRRQSKPSAEIQYTYVPTGSSEAIQVTLLPREDGLVELVGIDRDFSETMPVEAFFDGRWSDPVVARIEEENDIIAILILMIFFFPLAYVIVSGIFSWFRNRRLRRILRL